MNFKHDIFLEILGVHMLVRCNYEICAKQIITHFSQFLNTDWRSPDIIVHCQLPTAERKLFRAVDTETALVDVEIILPASGKISTWHYPCPLLPPYYLPPFKDRFVGLHAAAIQIAEQGAIVIAGARGHGKTTTAINLVNNLPNCYLLTDETVHIHQRSTAIEAFPIALQRCHYDDNNQPQGKYAIRAEEACRAISKKPTHISCLLFLEKNVNYQSNPVLQTIDSATTLQLLISHHVDLGCNKNDAMHTLFYLAKHVPAYQFCYHDYASLIENIPSFAAL